MLGINPIKLYTGRMVWPIKVRVTIVLELKPNRFCLNKCELEALRNNVELVLYLNP